MLMTEASVETGKYGKIVAVLALCISPHKRGKPMKRFSHFRKAWGPLSVTALSVLAVGTCAAQHITEITLPGERVFPESITSTSDGTLIVGSLGHGDILRILPGKTTATEWIRPGTGGLNNVLGVYPTRRAKYCGSVRTIWRVRARRLL
jgi:hypothetical protein